MKPTDYTHEEKQAALDEAHELMNPVEKTLVNAELVSGEVLFPKMNTVEVADEELYAVLKVHLWMNMLDDYRKPKIWYKATKKGTRVKFDFINNKEQYYQGIEELKVYIAELNEKYDIGIGLRVVKK